MEAVSLCGAGVSPGHLAVRRYNDTTGWIIRHLISSALHIPPDTLSHASGVEQYETAGHKSRVYARVTSARRRSRPDKLPFSFPPPPPVKATPESEQLLHHRLQRFHRQLHVSTTTVNHQRWFWANAKSLQELKPYEQSHSPASR